MCEHTNRVGDNHGESCLDCGKQLLGYGYGGWFGRRLIGKAHHLPCIHLWTPVGVGEEICCYCEEWREIK